MLVYVMSYCGEYHRSAELFFVLTYFDYDSLETLF